MKKVLFFILCLCACTQMSAQKVYNEEGKYYEMGYVEYGTSSKASSSTSALVMPRIGNKGTDFQSRVYTDESGQKIKFNNFFACINYFMTKGWSVLDINMVECTFIIRKEITKEQAKKLAQDCIKELK